MIIDIHIGSFGDIVKSYMQLEYRRLKVQKKMIHEWNIGDSE